VRRVVPILFAALAATAQDPAVFRGGVDEIVVDLVVRDKRGRLVRGLSQVQITVLEDGVPQQITAFRELQGAAPSETAASAAPNRIQLERQARIVPLVFERLGPDGRRFARQAAQDFVERDLGPNVFYGVFHVDRGLVILQPFTNDRERLKRAIDRATAVAPSDALNDSMAFDRVLQSNTGAATNAAAPGPGNSSVDGDGMSAAQAARVAQNMADFANMNSREDLGRVSIFALWGIIDQMSRLPGRKSVLYFAEGIQMPNGLVQQFHSMISAANRANVAVYTIDARGLMTSSDQGLARGLLEAAAARSTRARSTETTGAEEFRTFDTAMDSIRANVQNVMAELAESTGGSLMANSNDFRPFLRKLSEEFNTYYEVVYRPKRADYDGRFRTIAVAIDRPDVVIQARNGYFALPPMPGQTVYPYEVPLLKVMGSGTLPRDVDYRAALVPFHYVGGRQQASLIFDLPLDGVAFTPDGENYRTHVSFVALIKDANGQVVEKLSRDLPLNQPADKVEQFRQGRMIFTRAVRLAPGRYTVESAVADQGAGKAGARRAVVVVAERVPTGPSMSALTLVRRLDKPSPDPDVGDPFQLPDRRIIPTLMDTLPAAENLVLSVFLTGHADATLPERAELVLDLLRDGKLLARDRPTIEPPGNGGEFPYIANVPMGGLGPGQYEFRATLIQGKLAAQRSLFVNLR
jgi:VWFA-related protein